MDHLCADSKSTFSHFPSAEVVETSVSIDQQARDNYQFDIMQVMNVFLL